MIGHYAKATSTYYIPFLSATSGQTTLQWAREKSLKEGFKTAPDYQRLEMMFSLHYPKLKPDFDMFITIAQDVFKKWSDCEKSLESGQLPTSEQTKAFAVAWALVEMNADSLKAKVAKSMSAP